MNYSRTQKSIKNTAFALVSQLLGIVLGFVCRTVFIYTLGNSYLGISSLFSNVLSLLSITELGFSTAIIYTMYKPIADNDYRKVAALTNLYERVYRIIGIIILVIGIILIPFLNLFVSDVSQIPNDIPPLWIIYLMYLFNTLLTYFYGYKRSIIIATQNGYVNSTNTLIFVVCRNILQIIFLLLGGSFVIYLGIQIICTLFENVRIALIADKMYPFLHKFKNEKVSRDDLSKIKKNIVAMASYQLGFGLINGSDNLIITKISGFLVTGLYSNYMLLNSTVQELYRQILTPMTSTVGNLIATTDRMSGYNLFYKIFFLNGFLAIFTSVCLLSLINPFIELLWGKESLLSYEFVFIFIANAFVTCLRESSKIFIDTAGLFWHIRWKTVVEAFLNIVLSCLFGYWMNMGIIGVILGTLLSNLATNFWWEPVVVHRYYFNKSLSKYYLLYFKFFVCFSFSFIISNLFTQKLGISFIALIVDFIVCFFICFILFVLMFCKTEEFRFYYDLVNKIIKKAFKA